jgi:hypothetical protein
VPCSSQGNAAVKEPLYAVKEPLYEVTVACVDGNGLVVGEATRRKTRAGWPAISVSYQVEDEPIGELDDDDGG